MDTVDEVMKRPYSRILIPSEVGGFDAKVLEFPGCFAQGDTADEAMAELDEAMHLWLEEVIKADQPVPEPIEAAGHGGRMLIRVPKSWHRQIAILAEADSVSQNQWVLGAVGERLGAEGFSRRLAEMKLQIMIQATFGAQVDDTRELTEVQFLPTPDAHAWSGSPAPQRKEVKR